MKMKRLLAAVLFFCLLLNCIPPVQTNAAEAGDYTYTVYNGKATIKGYTGAGGNITIPSTLGGYPVTTIISGAFYNCDSLTSVEIPDSVTGIGSRAFSCCSSLTSVVIGDSVTSIGDSVFSDCDKLTSVEIPDSVTTIGDWAFIRCSNLTSVEIPNSVTTIGNYAFSECYSMTSVEFGDSVTSIGNYAFYYCFDLTSVKVPNSVTTIGEYMFCYCDSLTSVVIGDSVTSIGDYAFRSCSSLTKVIYCGTPEQWNAIEIGSNNTALTNAQRQYHDYQAATYTIPKTCSICGATDGEPAGHSYESVVTVPTCTEQGYTTHICTGCGDCYVDSYVDVTEHVYEDGVCTGCGYTKCVAHVWEEGTCTSCGQQLIEAIDLDRDGKITAFDAQVLAEAKAGLRQLTDTQWQALGDLQVADIKNYILGKFHP